MDKGRKTTRERKGNEGALQSELDLLKSRYEECEAALNKTGFQLGERLKELHCQNRMSEIFADLSLELDEVCLQILELIPPAWQFPEWTGAMIILEGQTFRTKGFTGKGPQLQQDIIAEGVKVGEVRISVKVPRTKTNDDPFLPEESDLIKSIVLRLGNVVALRKREIARRQGEALYHSILSASPDVITITDLEGKIRFSSERSVKMFGASSSNEFLGHPMLEYVDPSDHEKALVEIGKMLSGQLSGAAEYTGVRADGSKFDIEVNGEFLRDETGQPVEMIFVTRDITDRKYAERKLAKTEERFRTIVENLNDVVYEISNDGTINYVSPSIEKFLGYSPEELIGKNFFKYMHEEDIPIIMRKLNELENRNYEFLEYRYYTKKGQVRWVRSSTNPMFEDGILIGGRGILIDVTERKESEIRISQSEQKYKALFEYSPDGYLIFQDGIFVECNKASERLIGGSRADIIGKRPDEISPECQPNGKRSLDYVIEVVNKAFATGTNEFEWTHKRVDGTEFLALIHLAPVHYEGRDALLVSWKDVTLLKEAENKIKKSEEKYRSLFDFSPDGHLIIKDGVYVECNKAAEVLAGGDRYMIVGASPGMLSPEIQPGGRRSDDLAAEKNRETMEKGKNTFEWVHKRFDGTEFIAIVNLSVIDYEGGKAILVTWKDITALRQTELAIRKSEEKYRLMFETIRDVFYEADLSGIILEISPSVRFLSKGQFTREELIGKSLFTFYQNPHDRDRFLQKMSVKGTVDDFEVMLKNKDGSIIPVSLSSAFLYDQDGKPAKIAGSVRDITERRHADEELRKFRTIADKANYGMAIAELDGTMLYSNDYFARMHGWEVGEVIGKNLSMFHSEQQMVRVAEVIELLRKNGEFQAEEVWRTKKNGSSFPSLMNAIVVYSNGVPQYMSATALDITELKESQEQVVKSEEQLNNAQEIANMGSWDLYIRTGETSWSKNYYRLIERSADTFKSNQENFMKVVHPQDRSLINNEMNKILETKAPVSIDMRLMMPDGRIKWVVNHVVPEFSSGQLIALHGVNIDITAKKEQENEINKLKLAIEQSPVSIVITDLEAKIQYASPAFYHITGYTFEEVKGKDVRLLQSGKTPETVYKDLWETITSGKDWQGEWVNRRKDGSLYWESISITPILDENNTISSYLAVKQDISERKKAEQEIMDLNANLEKRIEERTIELALVNDGLTREIEERKQIEEELKLKTLELEQFFSVALDLLCIADTSGNFIKVNKAWERILGYSGEELEHRKFLEFVHPDDLQPTLDAMAKLDAQNPIFNFTNRYRSSDGTYLFVEWHSVPVGHRIYAAARDVTDRMKNEEELKKARLEAEEANQAKSEFLSRMSHELRTPMNSILGFAQLLERGELNSSQKKGVHHILSSGRHLLELINEVLDISRIEAGRISFSPEPVQLQGVIAEMIDLVQIMANTRQVRLQVIDSDAIRQFIKADRQRLKQILLNLINNAIKYNHDGGTVRISAENLPESPLGAEAIRILVKDTGMGISKEDIPKLFIPFERIGAENTETEGTGLGLTVVKKLIDLMGGLMGVESTLGEGSTFWIMMPKVDNQYEQIRNGNIDLGSKVSDQPWKGLILYIEDNKPNIDLVQDIIDSTRPGIKLITTAYGKLAHNMAAEFKPDLVLLDLNLPDIHGSEVLRTLKSDEVTQAIPIVIITADAVPSHINPLLKSGAIDCITKPLEIDHLLNILDRIFKKV